MDDSASDTRTSKEFSITIRPQDDDGVAKHLKWFLDWLDENCSHYAVGFEQLEGVETSHFQCAVVFHTERRADHLNETLRSKIEEIKPMTPDQKRRTVCCKKNRPSNDIRILAGGYCCKQDVAPFVKGWTLDELEPFYENYLELKRKALLRNIARDKIVSHLKEWHEFFHDHKSPEVRENFRCLSHRQRLGYMFEYGISQGADLQRYSTPVWTNYFLNNFRVLFCGRTAEGLVELLMQPRI